MAIMPQQEPDFDSLSDAQEQWSAEDAPDQPTNQEVEEDVKKPKEEAKTEEAVSESDPEIFDELDTKEESGEADQADKEATEDKPEEADETPEKPREVIKAADGTEYGADTVFQKKVDGKMEDVSLKNLLDTYSGKVAIEKRFSEANTVKQKAEHLQRQVDQKLTTTKQVIEKFFEHAQSGQFRDAMDSLCELTGADSERAWQRFQEISKVQTKREQELTDDEIRELEMREEAEYWKRRATKEREAGSTQDSSDLETQIDAAAQKANLTREEMQQGYKILLDAQKEGVYTKDITVDAVVGEALGYKTWCQIDDTCQKYLPEKVNDMAFYKGVLEDSQKYGITQEQWISLIKEIQEEPKAVSSKLAKKVADGNKVKGKKKATKSKKKVGVDDYDDGEPLFFDDE